MIINIKAKDVKRGMIISTDGSVVVDVCHHIFDTTEWFIRTTTDSDWFNSDDILPIYIAEQRTELAKGQTFEHWITEEGNNEFQYKIVAARAWGQFRVKLEKYTADGTLIETEGDLEVS